MENLGLPKDRQAFFSTKFIYQNRSNFWTGPWSDAYFYFYFFFAWIIYLPLLFYDDSLQ
jgi:hypothetical protein